MEQPAPTTLEYGSPETAPRWTLTRVIAWMWVYPLATLGFIYGTWATAALTLGHAPGMYVDDPSGINWLTRLLQPVCVVLIVFGVPLSFVHVVMAIVAAIGMVAEWRWEWRRLAWCTATVVAWGLIWWDPGRVTDWLMD